MKKIIFSLSFLALLLNAINSTAQTWSPLGPIGSPVCNGCGHWYGTGRAQAIAFDPNYTTNHTMYLGSCYGGLFKSTNSGTTWSPVQIEPGVPFSSVSDIIVDPTDGNIIYIATGDADGFVGTPSVGVYKSTNGGSTWASGGLTFLVKDNVHITNLAIIPGAHLTLFAATTKGIYRTQNGGGYWSSMLTETATDPDPTSPSPYKAFRAVVVKPGSTTEIYASGYRIYKSSDAGGSWTPIDGTGTGLDYATDAHFTGKKFRTENIAVTSNGIIFATIMVANSYYGSGRTEYLYRFNGSTWTYKNSNPPTAAYTESWMRGLQALNDNVCYLSTSNLIKFDNTTGNWTDISGYNGSMHGDVHNIKMEPGSTTNCFIVSDGGAYYYNGSVITEINANLNLKTIGGEGVAADNSGRIIIGNQDTGPDILNGGIWTNKSSGSGYWAGDAYDSHIDYTNSNTLFFETPYGASGHNHNSSLIQSKDGGQTWASVDKDLSGNYLASAIHPADNGFIIQDPKESNKLYFGGLNSLFRSDNGGDLNGTNGTFYSVSDWQQAPFNVGLYQITLGYNISPANNNYIYASVWNYHPPYQGSAIARLFKSVNGGGTLSTDWTEVTPDLTVLNSVTTEQASFYKINSVACSFTNTNKVWIAYSKDVDPSLTNYANINNVSSIKVKSTTNGGTNWSDFNAGLSNDVNVFCILYHQGSNDRLYLGTDRGVYYRDATMTQWQKLGTSCPSTVVKELVINYCNNTLYAATYGSGVWSLAIPPIHNTTPLEYKTVPGETWSSSRQVNTDVVIEAGNTLTINNGAIISMPTNGYIKVMPGGKLVLNGATLTNSCGGLWSGIQVLGNNTLPQTATNQGTFVMQNNAKIQNAYVGVMADEAIYTAADFAYPNGIGWKGGGIIQIDNNNANGTDDNFLNCRICIGFSSYHGQIINNVEQANKSYLKRTRLRNTGFLNAPDNTLYTNTFISMWDVHGVLIQGNRFFGPPVNPSSATVKGIVSGNSDYYVNDYCPTLGCTPVHNEFHDMYRGVYSVVYDPAALTRLFVIDDNVFTNVTRGVFLSGQNNPRVTRNQMSLIEPVDTTYGIYLHHCDFYRVEENNITGLANPQPLSWGIIVNYSLDMNLNINDDNLIYKNYLTNLYYGSISRGINANYSGNGTGVHGLEFRCNEYTNTRYAIAVYPDVYYNYQGTIKQEQGSCNPSNPVNNKFNSIPAGGYALWNGPNTTIQYYCSGTSPCLPLSSQVTTWFHINSCALACDNTYCPSNFDGNGKLLKMTANFSPSNAKVRISANKTSSDSLLNFIDGGSTAYLMSQIADPSITSSALKTTLLNTGGSLLSDTVLLAALNRSPTMTTSDTRNIIITNSPVTDTVWNVLSVVKPALITNAQVLAAQEGVSDRDQLESHVGTHNLRRYMLLNDLVSYYQESDLPDSAYDYLSQQQINYLALPLAVQTGKMTSAQNMVNQMATNNADAVNLKTYMQMMVTKHSAGQTMDNVSPTELNTISGFASESTYAGTLGLNLKTQLSNYHFYEKLPVIDSSQLRASRPKQIPSAFAHLSIYPNPSSETVTIDLSGVNDEDNLSLQIFDAFGKLIRVINLPEGTTSATVNVKSYTQGIYYCQLYSNTTMLDFGKMIVVKE